MEELNYLRRKCDAIEALKSRICKDLSKVEEIVSDLKNFFEANHDSCWKASTIYRLYEILEEIRDYYLSIEYIMP